MLYHIHTVVQIFIVSVRLVDAGRVFSTNYTFWSEVTLFLLVEVLQILVGGKQVWVGVAGQERDQPAGQSAGHAGPGAGLEGRAGHRPAVPAHHGGPAGGGPPQRPDHAAHAAKPSSVARTYQGRSLSVLCGYFIG